MGSVAAIVGMTNPYTHGRLLTTRSEPQDLEVGNPGVTRFADTSTTGTNARGFSGKGKSLFSEGTDRDVA